MTAEKVLLIVLGLLFLILMIIFILCACIVASWSDNDDKWLTFPKIPILLHIIILGDDYSMMGGHFSLKRVYIVGKLEAIYVAVWGFAYCLIYKEVELWSF